MGTRGGLARAGAPAHGGAAQSAAGAFALGGELLGEGAGGPSLEEGFERGERRGDGGVLLGLAGFGLGGFGAGGLGGGGRLGCGFGGAAEAGADSCQHGFQPLEQGFALGRHGWVLL
jgi:hypothetical protein